MNSVRKALDILEFFLEERGDAGIAELARSTGINVSSAHRIASTLVERGYLGQTHKGGEYSLGLKLLQFARTIQNRIRINAIARPFLERLSREADESVNLAVLDADQARFIELIEGEHLVRTTTTVGRGVPLHSTGVGKILLANMTGKQLKEYLDGHELVRYTGNTITDPQKLKQELLAIKQDDIARDNEETEQGMRCVATPVRDGDGDVVAAISVSGPSVRMGDSKLSALDIVVKNYGVEISRAMGYEPR